jgi:spore coat polysaccharide biosynthesis protein SpsF
MKIDIIVQVRMGATRLPNKVLREIDEKPMLYYVVNRLRKSTYVSDVIVATTTNERDKAIIKYCEDTKVKYYVGSELDVLDRYYQASKVFGSDVIVRVTGDCPLVDSRVIDSMISYFVIHNFDYLTNTHFENAYPSGFDCCIIRKDVLEEYWNFEKDMKKREHAFGYMIAYPEKYKIKLFSDISIEFIDSLKFNFNEVHLSVDTINDFNLIVMIMEHFIKNHISLLDFTFYNVIEYLNRNPEITKINYVSERFADIKKINKRN